VGERTKRSDVKDGERVFAVVYAALAENHGNEVDTGGAKEGKRCGFSEELEEVSCG
jgi:hypothetical protein